MYRNKNKNIYRSKILDIKAGAKLKINSKSIQRAIKTDVEIYDKGYCQYNRIWVIKTTVIK